MTILSVAGGRIRSVAWWKNEFRSRWNVSSIVLLLYILDSLNQCIVVEIWLLSSPILDKEYAHDEYGYLPHEEARNNLETWIVPLSSLTRIRGDNRRAALRESSDAARWSLCSLLRKTSNQSSLRKKNKDTKFWRTHSPMGHNMEMLEPWLTILSFR